LCTRKEKEEKGMLERTQIRLIIALTTYRKITKKKEKFQEITPRQVLRTRKDEAKCQIQDSN
jgi:carbamoylphosphate synthase large subunit